ncbi:major facilitator superfamily domain-containing protein [Phellopilus nigrolimitatus]|nr:major facilitator superfamily domain-containing protein [Phellopilus nigrolimitatus]
MFDVSPVQSSVRQGAMPMSRAHRKGETTKAVLSEADDDATVQDVVNGCVPGEKIAPEKSGEDSPSEGGLSGWMTVFGAWLVQFTGFGYANDLVAYGVQTKISDFYVRVYLSNYTSSQISWIGSTQLFIMMSVGIISGRLFDKGYFYLILVPGSILYVFSLFMLSLAKPEKFYQVFLAQAIGGGIGSGTSYVPCVAVLAQHFKSPHKRALTMALVASGSSFGGVVHPIMLNNFFNGPVGFATGVQASAGLIAGLLIIAISTMRTKKDGGSDKKELIPLGVAVRKFSKDSAYICMVAAMFLVSLGLFFPIFYLQLDASLHGVESNFAFYSISILNGCSMVGRIIPGFLSRKVGVLNVLIFTGLSCAAVIFGMLGLNALGGVAAIGVMYGFSSGSYVTLLPPMLTMLADHPSEIGARMGIGFAFQGLGALVGTPISGALLTTDFIWWRPIVFSGVLAASGTCSYVACRYNYKRKRNVKGWVV